MKKLLSHRVRGFSESEHTPKGFKKACETPVPYIEIDTRASSDNEIFVWHNPRLPGGNGRIRFADGNSQFIKRIEVLQNESLLTLRQALEIFSKRKFEEQKLCIDVKDYGFEQEHLSLIEEYGLEQNIVLVSWIPQTLVKFSMMVPGIPLIFSHLNFHRLGKLGNALDWALRNSTFKFLDFVILGSNKFTSDLGSLAKGYQHACIVKDIPTNFVEILSNSGGGICLHKSLLCKSLLTECKKYGLQTWVFSAKNLRQYVKYAGKDNVDVVFCDNVPLVYQQQQRKDIYAHDTE